MIKPIQRRLINHFNVLQWCTISDHFLDTGIDIDSAEAKPISIWLNKSINDETAVNRHGLAIKHDDVGLFYESYDRAGLSAI